MSGKLVNLLLLLKSNAARAMSSVLKLMAYCDFIDIDCMRLDIFQTEGSV